MADEKLVFENLIQYRTQGEAEALSGAQRLDEALDKLRAGADVGISLDISNDDVLAELDALDAASYSPSIELDITGDDLSELTALDEASFTPAINPELDGAPVAEVTALDETAVTPAINPALDDSDIQNLLALDAAALTPTIDPTLDSSDADVTSLLELDAAVLTPAIDPELDSSDEDVSTLLALDDESLTPAIDPELNTEPVAEVLALDETTVTPSVDPELDAGDEDVAALLALDDAALTPAIDPVLADPDGTLKTLDDLNKDKIEPQVEAQETDKSKAELEGIRGRLDALLAFKAIEIAMNVAGNILDVLNKLERFTLDPILNLDDSLARVNANTRGLDERLDDVGATITRLRYDSEQSFDTVTGVVIELARQTNLSGDEFESAASAILKFKSVFGANEIAVLGDTANIVGAGLADTFEEALDITATAFQIGGDRAGDFLKVMGANSNALRELGLSGQEAMAFIASGLDAGFISATQAGNALEIFNQQLALAAADEKSDASVLLGKLGLDNPKATGEAVGAEFIEAVLAGIRSLPADAQADAVGTLFGAKALKKGVTPFIEGVTTEFEALGQGAVEGTLENAWAAAEDTIRGTIDDLFQLAEQLGMKVMQELGIPKFLSDLKTGLQEMMTLVSQGASLGEALEKGLHIQGVDEFINRLQSAIGNFTIGLLEMIAGIQEFLGRDASGTRAEVARLAEGQLAYDLKIANEDEVAGVIQTAVNRGVSEAALSTSAQTAVQELLAAGQVGAARELLNTLQNSASSFVLSPTVDTSKIEGMATKAMFDKAVAEQDLEVLRGLAADGLVLSVGLDMTGVQADVDEAAADMQQQLNEALAASDVNLAARLAKNLGDSESLSRALNAAIDAGDVDIVSQLVNDLRDNAAVLQEAFDAAMAGGNLPVAETIATTLGSEDLLAEVEVLKEVLEDTKMNTSGASAAVARDVTAMSDTVAAEADEMAGAMETADARMSLAMTGNTMTRDMAAVRAAAATHLPQAAQKFKELERQAVTSLAIVKSWAEITIGALMGFGNVSAVLDTVAGKLEKLANAATGANAVMNSVSAAAASGGAAPASGTAAAPASPFAPLLGAVAGSTISNSRQSDITIQNVYHVSSQAQASSAAQQTANNLRGFA